MHMCDFFFGGGGVTFLSFMPVSQNSRAIYTLEQYYSTALYRQQIPIVWLGRKY